jgi:hypothetical protein
MWPKGSIVPASFIEPALSEVADWDLMDANVRVGPSGVHGELALATKALLAEMDRFGVKTALVSHFTAEEYDAAAGNRALARDLDSRFVPAWAALPESSEIGELASRNPAAVRMCFGVSKHNFSIARWCSGELFEYLQQYSILAVVSREDLQLAGGAPQVVVDWNALAVILENFPRLPVLLLDCGYRVDRYLFPLLKRFQTLYFDSSTYLAHRQLEAFVERFGPQRVVFGSRLPFYTPAAALAVLLTARIPDDAKLAIAGNNLRCLLKRAIA